MSLEKLVKAARNNNFSKVEKLINANPQLVKDIDDNKCTALHLIFKDELKIKSNQIENFKKILNTIINAGANVEALDNEKNNIFYFLKRNIGLTSQLRNTFKKILRKANFDNNEVKEPIDFNSTTKLAQRNINQKLTLESIESGQPKQKKTITVKLEHVKVIPTELALWLGSLALGGIGTFVGVLGPYFIVAGAFCAFTAYLLSQLDDRVQNNIKRDENTNLLEQIDTLNKENFKIDVEKPTNIKNFGLTKAKCSASTAVTLVKLGVAGSTVVATAIAQLRLNSESEAELRNQLLITAAVSSTVTAGLAKATQKLIDTNLQRWHDTLEKTIKKLKQADSRYSDQKSKLNLESIMIGDEDSNKEKAESKSLTSSRSGKI